MLKKIVLTSVAIVSLGMASPAVAHTGQPHGTDTWGAEFRHQTDDGYDPVIGVRCDFGNPDSGHGVAEGTSADGAHAPCPDVDQVHVRDGEEIWCEYLSDKLGNTTWEKKFDATGWHKVDNLWNDGLGCVAQVD